MYVTEWFSVNPVHVGVYEREMSKLPKDDQDLTFSFWDGSRWLLSGFLEEAAEEGTRRPKSISNYQALSWRGVAR